MPKQKTHKATKKRFRVTANGKVKHGQVGKRHLNTRLSKRRRRNLRGTDVLATQTETTRIIGLLAGYSY